MSNGAFTDSVVEEAALAWLAGLGDAVAFGPSIGPGEPAAERADWGIPFRACRLRDALLPKLLCGALRLPDAERPVHSVHKVHRSA